MDQICSREVHGLAGGQEILLLWDLKLHYTLH
jgi:hypothetical protein